MMKIKGHIIKEIKENSIAKELELSKKDKLIAINGEAIEDRFDYEFLIQEEYLELLVEKQNGEEWVLEIEKEFDEDLGIIFENTIMDEYRSCKNKCIFCFIDQMPKGMRETLYFKDDDSRLSFLQGNYITLTNMTHKDIERIIKYKLSPINISVHTTNPRLRCEMLHNRFAGEALKKIERLYEADTPMNGQIVLCKGINDGAELRRSIEDLMKYLPHMQSISVVPAGLTKFRDGLHPLDSFTETDANDIIDVIEQYQRKSYKTYGTHFVHASDELYILAKRQIPEEARYDGYLQLENGVGMVRLFINEVTQTLEKLSGDNRSIHVSIATGVLADTYIKDLVSLVRAKFPGIIVNVFAIKNHYFGEKITVSGLITGQDLMEQLKGQELGQKLLLPINMFRSGEEVFLDDVTRQEVQRALQVPVSIVKSSGQDFVSGILHGEAGTVLSDLDMPAYSAYELKEITKYE